MNRNTTVSLIREFKSGVKNQTLSDMLVTKANDYIAQGLTESEVFSAVLKDVKDLNESLNSETVTETIDKYSKFEKSPVMSVQTMMKECGLSRSVRAIKESSIYTDPIVKTAVSRIDEALTKLPEFKFLPNFIEILKPFGYDSTVKIAVTEAFDFMQKNSAKLIVLNSIYEMRMVPANVYSNIISILEQSLLDDLYTADALSMKLREQINIPVVKTLISNLSLVEGKINKSFNLGLGNTNTLVESVIAPSVSANGKAVVLLNNTLFTITESEVKFMTEAEKSKSLNEFYSFCQNFAQLGFKSSASGIKASNLRNIEFEMKNEGENLSLYLNKQKVDDAKKINYSSLFIMENGGSRQFLASIFENINYVNSLDFIKQLVSENKSAYIVNLKDSIFVIENTSAPTITKMTQPQLHKYVLENFKYDLRALYETELTDQEKEISQIDKERDELTENIAKLEGSIKTLDESLAKNLDEDDAAKVVDLKYVIEKQIIALKDKYISLEAKKKKLFETETLSSNKSYKIHEKVRLKDGRFGEINGVDTHAGRYMIKTEDGKILPYKSKDIE